jgi:hypothetical protein
MLTVFIVPSEKENADQKKTIASFSGMDIGCTLVSIETWREVNLCQSKHEWYGIIWDNEYIDDYLKEAIPIYFRYPKLDALILYKKISMIDATWRYRFFRRSIYLMEDFAPFSFWMNKEVVLDGWILEHEHTG